MSAASGGEGAPRISIVIVSDYEPGAKTWEDERNAVRAFLDDDPGEPFEIVVMESLAAFDASPAVPSDLAALAPRVTVRFDAALGSAALKDAALKHCRGELIAVVEADCLPERGWLAHLVRRMDADPTLDVVSGRTHYGDESALLRVMTLLDRGYLEERKRGRFVHIANNGALYRKRVLERYPYPDEPNPFASAELRLAAMLRDGVCIGFENDARMRHAYGGFAFLADVRRNKGYQAARIILHRRPASAHLSTLGLALRAVRTRLRYDLRVVRSVGGSYLRAGDWPLLWLMFLAVRVPEFMGALSAKRPERFAAVTKYR